MLMRIQLSTFMLIRIRILLLVKGIGPPRLCSEPLKLLNFYFNADLDPAFRCNADPDPIFKNNADPDLQPWYLEKECSNTATGITISISS
jgi:hypothetical protein